MDIFTSKYNKLEFFITKNKTANYIRVKIEESFDLTFDHSPVTMRLSKYITEKQCNSTLINKLTNWEQIKW